ncbi:MAG: SGNH/GDSL hydrolase family protein [Candidatus Sericytochromatia bacterium]
MAMSMWRKVWLGAALAGLMTGCGAGAGTPAGEWLAFGDSITAGAFASPSAWSQSLGAGVTVRAVGMPGATAAEAVGRLEGALAENPSARFVALGFGTNDAYRGNTPGGFKAMMTVMVDRARAAGRTPIIATIPYGTDPKLSQVPAFNAAIAELRTEAGLPAGPDLYAHFRAHPEELAPDGIHMTETGHQAIQRLWANVAKALRVP